MAVKYIPCVAVCILALTIWVGPAVSASPDQTPLVASAAKVSASDGTARVQVTTTNAASKNIAAYTVILQAVGSDGMMGPRITHTEVLAFSPAMRNGSYPDGLKPSTSRRTERLKSPVKPDGTPFDKYTVTTDYVLFQDGSEWGPDTLHTADRISGTLRGWQISHGYLKSLLETKGAGAVVDDLSH